MKKILDNTRPLTCLHFNKKSFLAQKNRKLQKLMDILQ